MLLLFIAMAVNVSIQTAQVKKQTTLVKKNVETVYKQAFPSQGKLKYSRIKKKLKTMLQGVDAGGNEFGLLPLLNDLTPMFVANPDIKPSNIKFDKKKNEVRLLISGSNFQAFDKFAAALPKHYSLKQGALNSSKNRVSGLLTIRKK